MKEVVKNACIYMNKKHLMNNITKILLLALTGITSFSLANAKPAEEAWLNLTGKKFAQRPEFAYVVNNPALPNVLLYGDSISIAYTQRVRKQLDGKANVYRIYANGSSSKALIGKTSNMHSVMTDKETTPSWDFQWDVIHFNVGLHDLKYLAGKKKDKVNGTQVADVSTYQENLRKITTYLKELAPKATLIFATTTPVPEGAEGRFAGDAEKYNTAALEVFKEHPEIVINDLFSLTKPNHAEWMIEPKDVHYNDKGSDAQGDQVAKSIMEALAEKAK